MEDRFSVTWLRQRVASLEFQIDAERQWGLTMWARYTELRDSVIAAHKLVEDNMGDGGQGR